MFCAKCSEHEATIEVLRNQHYTEMQCMMQKLKEANTLIAKQQGEIEALSFDVAFYNGSITNLSCNNK